MPNQWSIQGFRLWRCYDFPGNGTIFNKNLIFPCSLLTVAEKMAEMRRPMDFWKGMVCFPFNLYFSWFTNYALGTCSNIDLCGLSPIWGIHLRKSLPHLPIPSLKFIYVSISPSKDNSRYHSPTKELANLLGKPSVSFLTPPPKKNRNTTSKYSLTNWWLGNVLSLITGIIAAGLYGNIGISKFFFFFPFFFIRLANIHTKKIINA